MTDGRVVLQLHRFIDSRFFVFWCFAVFVLLRAVPVFFLPLEMDSDAGWYLGRGLDLAAGKGYSEGGHLTAYWPVGYPGFLGALFYIFGKQAIVGQVANLVLAGASFFLVLGLGRQIFRSESTARVSALLLALYPNNVAYTPLLLTEIYFTFLLLLAVYIYITKSSTLWVLLAGLVFGLAALTKPQVLFLPGLLALLPLLSREGRASTRRHIINGMMLYAAMAVILVPWALRNTLVFGETVLISTNGGATLLTGNNPSADGGYVPDDPLVAQRNFTVQDQVAADRRAKALAMQWITENPRRFLELVPLKIWHLWYKDGEAEWAYQSGYAQYERYRYLFRSARALNQAYYALLILAFVASLVLLRKSHRSLAWPWVVFGYIYVVYLTLISIVFSGQPRLHFPAMPWIIMYAAWAMTVLPQITSRGTSRSVAA